MALTIDIFRSGPFWGFRVSVHSNFTHKNESIILKILRRNCYGRSRRLIPLIIQIEGCGSWISKRPFYLARRWYRLLFKNSSSDLDRNSRPSYRWFWLMSYDLTIIYDITENLFTIVKVAENFTLYRLFFNMWIWPFFTLIDHYIMWLGLYNNLNFLLW